ncbi:hypothetical protein BT63DRAFT_476981 [Microthyrium microscopicum]|uniref:Stress-response A/B barrel domain-containing protein n=1 Tax=Microthyrium microscopicum TaxID=703497 RepID=A0A6A6UIZ5_9PEZI|nr:hypothetical protein BT63DRAFT_476981 [Microthyrium microscopicum]
MGITHIVLFQFKSSTSPDEIKEISNQFLSLKDTCIHPTTKTAYIKTITGGLNNSPETHGAHGFTHGYVVEFNNADDRNHYVDHDEAHDTFKKFVRQHVEKVQILDYENGIF